MFCIFKANISSPFKAAYVSVIITVYLDTTPAYVVTTGSSVIFPSATSLDFRVNYIFTSKIRCNPIDFRLVRPFSTLSKISNTIIKLLIYFEMYFFQDSSPLVLYNLYAYDKFIVTSIPYL